VQRFRTRGKVLRILRNPWEVGYCGKGRRAALGGAISIEDPYVELLVFWFGGGGKEERGFLLEKKLR
jgi:hypothetical protein